MTPPDAPDLPASLRQKYRTRFAGRTEYRRQVWSVLCGFFSRWIPPDAVVLDLGAGHCEFINAVAAARKYAMDLNPDTLALAGPGVNVLQQDCSRSWGIPPGTLDAVFTSNFFEHLPDKAALERTIIEVGRALRPGGTIVAMGPNIKCVPGAYWDFFDHHIPLTERSLVEVMVANGFAIERVHARFLPYTMSQGRMYPAWMLRAYLAVPWAWPVLGRQFLVVARRVPR
jgi:SAM-dependent methyltransferase